MGLPPLLRPIPGMRIAKVPAFVLEHYGIRINRKTAYNWCDQGLEFQLTRNPDKVYRKGMEFIRVVTPEQIAAFIARRSRNAGN